jgi:hypothetical protein
MSTCHHIWVDSGYRHCYVCGMRMSDYRRQQSQRGSLPKVGSVTHNFDLAVEVHTDGSATVTLSDPGSFDVPIAETTAATVDKALVVLAGMLTIPTPRVPIIRVTNDDTGEVHEDVLSTGVISGGSSHFGHYVGKAVVEEALGFGWHDEMARGAVETYDDWYFREDWPHADHWHDMVTEAEEWLNEHTEGGLWHWADGDFRIDATEECPQCGDQRFANPDAEDTTCGEHLSWD